MALLKFSTVVYYPPQLDSRHNAVPDRAAPAPQRRGNIYICQADDDVNTVFSLPNSRISQYLDLKYVGVTLILGVITMECVRTSTLQHTHRSLIPSRWLAPA